MRLACGLIKAWLTASSSQRRGGRAPAAQRTRLRLCGSKQLPACRPHARTRRRGRRGGRRRRVRRARSHAGNATPGGCAALAARRARHGRCCHVTARLWLFGGLVARDSAGEQPRRLDCSGPRRRARAAQRGRKRRREARQRYRSHSGRVWGRCRLRSSSVAAFRFGGPVRGRVDTEARSYTHGHCTRIAATRRHPTSRNRGRQPRINRSSSVAPVFGEGLRHQKREDECRVGHQLHWLGVQRDFAPGDRLVGRCSAV